MYVHVYVHLCIFLVYTHKCRFTYTCMARVYLNTHTHTHTSGECLSGALQWKELMQIATEVGFVPPILVKSIVFTCNNPEVQQLLGKSQVSIYTLSFILFSCVCINKFLFIVCSDSTGASDLKFCSATYRLVKTDPKPTSGDSLVEVQYNGSRVANIYMVLSKDCC